MATALNTNGVILTVDIISEGSFGQIVIPMAAEESSVVHLNRLAENAVGAFKTGGGVDALIQMLSEKASVVGLGAEPMVNGLIPYRENYPLTQFPGIRGADEDVEPSNVGAVVDFYFDPDDIGIGVGHRTKVCHNTIPGIAETDTGGNELVDALVTLVQTFGDALVGGLPFDDTGNGGDNLTWKRVNRALRGAVNQTLYVAIKAVAKKIVGSVERRLAPPRR